MSEVNKDLVSQAERASQYEGSEHVEIVLKSILTGMPVVGGTFAYLFEKYIPDARAERFQKFTIDLARAVESLDGKFDQTRVNSDEFAYLVVSTYERLNKEYLEEKLNAYRNMLVNSLLLDVNAEMQQRYFLLVDRLSVLHLHAMRVAEENIRAFQAREEAADMRVPLEGQEQFEDYKSCYNELVADGFIDVHGYATPVGRRFAKFISAPAG